MSTATLAGFEYLTAIKNGEIESSPMSQIIPMHLTVVKQGYVEYVIRPDDRHFNLQGGIHGGFCATALDSATGAAVHTTVDAGVRFATIDLNVKMLKALKSQQSYTVIGKVIRTGRNVLCSEGRIIDQDGAIYAFASATLLVTSRSN